MPRPRHARFDCSPGCPVEGALAFIDGKWKGVILFHLQAETLRFNQLRRKLPHATQRMLTNQLRELERDGLVIRTVYAEVPPKVEYRLSPLGQSLEPVINALKSWGDEHLEIVPAEPAEPEAALVMSTQDSQA
ncbi:winged helix-turn-helix transcriptional regulator [Lichenihabitans psoromatis]|uniref:winged helix-turn-helix transcriptional regulator n=1 Tax=Lichenihabitans psoromatis TaxID=2528642 RepID=UPI0010356F16|nr:helix-turn-helix domain-containing protein [Lichenihabitans psoromatis]